MRVVIEFVTLLLGLVTGVQAVEVSVGADVARVEFILDGHAVGSVDHPPWFINCDFGTELAPHELVVVAYDADEKPLGRVRQRVNLPRQRAEARLVLDRAQSPPTARVIWSTLDSRDTPAALVTLDGQRLEFDDLEAIELPPHDPDAFHLLRAELLFPGAERLSTELVFGGAASDAVWTELTALPMNIDKKTPKAERMAGWFHKGDQPLETVAVETGPVDLVVVRERSPIVRAGLDFVYQRYLYERSSSRLPPVDVRVLGNDDRVRFVFPTTGRERVPSGLGLARPGTEQVPVSRPLRVKRQRDRRPPLEGEEISDFGSLFEILTTAFYSGFDDPTDVHELADAVAIAGLTAAAGDRRRVVLLIVAGDTIDSSRLAADEVRAYLDKLRVPLLVWSVSPEEEDPTLADGLAPWQPSHDISSRKTFNEALDELRKTLRSQILVWLEGAHLAYQIETSPKAKDLRPVVDIERPQTTRVAERPRLKTSRLGPYSFETEVTDRRLTTKLARIAELHQQVYQERYGLDFEKPTDGQVILFANESRYLEFKRLQGHERVEIQATGYFQSPSLVVLQQGEQSREEVAASLIHELTHLASWRTLAGSTDDRAMPPWLDEGLAGDLALASLGRRGLAAEPLGPTNLAYGTRLGLVLVEIEEKIRDGDTPPLRELLAMDRATFLADNGQLNYILSALWVRFLLAGDSAEGFRAYLAEVTAGGDPGTDALLSHLNSEADALEGAFHNWLSRLRQRLPAG